MPEYSKDQFYIHSTDTKGHGVGIRCQIPPDQNRRMTIAIADPRTPYQTPQDFVRDAIVHRLAMLAETNDDAQELLNVMLIDNQAGYTLALIEASERLVEKYRQIAQRMSNEYERNKLAEEIQEIVDRGEEVGLCAVDARQLEMLVDRLRAF